MLSIALFLLANIRDALYTILLKEGSVLPRFANSGSNTLLYIASSLGLRTNLGNKQDIYNTHSIIPLKSRLNSLFKVISLNLGP